MTHTRFVFSIGLVVACQILVPIGLAADAPSCARPIDPATFVSSGEKAVTGASGQRLYMRLRHPDTCKLSMATVCKATAYIISGDHVSSGDTCGEWTSVRFQGKKHEVYGWVESYRLTDATDAPSHSPSMSMASFPKTPVWCAGVRDYYDGDLLDQISKPPFEELSNPRPWEQKTGRAADPPPDFKPHSGADDSEEESTFLAIGTEDINGTPLTFVEVTTGESCSAATHIEMWSSDLKHYLGNGEDALKHLADRGDNARLVRIQGKQYLIQEHYHWRPDEIEVIGF